MFTNMFSIQFHTPVSKGQIKLAKTRPDDLKLKVNKKKNGEIKKNVCDLCNYKCGSNSKLNEHMNTRHGTQVSVTGLKHNGLVYLCVQCGFECKQKYSIVSHVERTHDETTFSCKQCSYVANCKANLSWHMRRKHEKKIANPCNICSFQSIRVELLRKHMASHRENCFECPKCDFVCKFRRTLTKHMKSSHEMNWRCPTCNLYVISSSALKTHKTQEHVITDKRRNLEQEKDFQKSKNETVSLEEGTSPKSDSTEIVPKDNILDITTPNDGLSATDAVATLLEIFNENSPSEIEPLILDVEDKCSGRKNQSFDPNSKSGVFPEKQRILGPSLFVVKETITKNVAMPNNQDDILRNLKGEIAMLLGSTKIKKSKRKVYKCAIAWCELETISLIQYEKHMQTWELNRRQITIKLFKRRKSK